MFFKAPLLRVARFVAFSSSKQKQVVYLWYFSMFYIYLQSLQNLVET